MLNKKLLALLLLIGLTTTSCASDQTFIQSEQAIADLGYTNIQYEGWAWFSCGVCDYMEVDRIVDSTDDTDSTSPRGWFW